MTCHNLIGCCTKSSSISAPSKHIKLLTLGSELALLLVARGESDTLTWWLRVGPALDAPDLMLYMDDAGMFVISGRRLFGMLFLISYIVAHF